MIYFIYNANGSFFGEISYFLKKLSGRDKCKLCDLSHNLIFQRKSWEAVLKEFDRPHLVLHINELPESIKQLNLTYPSILLEKENSLKELVSRRDFEHIDNLSQLKETLQAKIN